MQKGFDDFIQVQPLVMLIKLFRFEEYLRSWMKKIQELLLESEQLRLETDDAGPQVNIFIFMDLRTFRTIFLSESYTVLVNSIQQFHFSVTINLLFVLNTVLFWHIFIRFSISVQKSIEYSVNLFNKWMSVCQSNRVYMSISCLL